MTELNMKSEKMKSLLICHDGALLDRFALPRWLASFSDVVGIVILRETQKRLWRRIRKELERSGVRILDAFAYRLYYHLALGKRDRLWEEEAFRKLCTKYPENQESIPLLYSHSPNTRDVEEFIRRQRPDIVLARCKTLLKESVFSVPTTGTFVMHPGICPEYRNAHGCFWALAENDLENVGMTLLKIDKGVDTGPIYGYYRYKYDEVEESHIVIQHRVVYDNLAEVQEKLIEIYRGEARPIDVRGRPSATWGQPWLSRYLQWKYRARRRRYEGRFSPVP